MTNRISGNLGDYTHVFSPKTGLIVNLLDIQFLQGRVLKPGLAGYNAVELYVKNIVEPYKISVTIDIYREIVRSFRSTPNVFVGRDQSCLVLSQLSLVVIRPQNSDLFLKGRDMPLKIPWEVHRELLKFLSERDDTLLS